MQRRLWSTLACVMLLIAPATSLLTPPARAMGADLLVLRTGFGQAAKLAMVQVDGPSAQSLPLGLLDRSGRTLYSARPQSDGTTLVQAIDLAGGRQSRSMRVPGAFSTQGGDYAEGAVTPYSLLGNTTPAASFGALSVAYGTPRGSIAGSLALRARPLSLRAPRPTRAGFPADGSAVLSALSFNARWLALRDMSVSTNETRFIVIDTQKMRVVDDHTLGGQFGLDAITADGKMLYLIQSLPNIGFGVYQVRSFSVARNILDDKVIVERGEKPGSMSGEAWTRVWSPDGSWLYTLYVEDSGHAFIHALNLRARQTRCLDFPAISKNVALMAHFTLSAAPDGRALYAINPVLGVVVAVRDLPEGKMRLARLAQHAGGPVRTQAGAAISADGRTVFVATGAGVWTIDTSTLALTGAFVRDQEVASVAISHDGRPLYALSPASGQIDVLDPANGSIEGSMQPSANAWAIEGVS